MSAVDHSTPAEPGAAPPSGRLGPNYFRLFGASAISNLGDGIGMIAYPWLASAVTRNPVLVAVVFAVQRLPWLLFSLPAGVITDRLNRRALMIWANVGRALITLGVAVIVLGQQGTLPTSEELDAGLDVPTNTMLYLLVLLASMLLGVGEVLYDNAAQTFMPAIVHRDRLEKANGRLWSAEMVANTFVGPPLGAFLIAVSFSLPFFVDAATFAVSAALISLITVTRRAGSTRPTERAPWTRELAEGFRWLWKHPLLRPLAITLGILNALGMMTTAGLVLFGQEVLGTTATEFAIMGTGGAVGAVVGGWTASWFSERLGPGHSLALTLIGSGVFWAATGFSNHWTLVWIFFGLSAAIGTVWNVITVSLRQTIIPDHLLGRVNSVYRFFGWGMIPIGAALGGLTIWFAELFTTRELALRMPWFVAGVLSLVLFVVAAPKLTTAKIEAARAAAADD